MDFLDDYPVTKAQFYGWMIETYGVTAKTFSKAPWVERCRAVARYLGYPTVFPTEWTNAYLEEQIRDYLYLYESARISYPYGSGNLTKELNRMMYDELNEKFPTMHTPAEIFPSLKDALVKLDNSYKMPFLPSLNQALVNMLEPVKAVVDDDKFWQQAIEDSWKKLKAPF